MDRYEVEIARVAPWGEFDPDDADLPEFYWTVRSMAGDRATELRARIRRQVGIDRLSYVNP